MTAQQAKVGWDNLFLTGSVLDLDVSMWAARTKIKPADLGIEDSAEVHKVLSLGNHRLIPAEAFEDIRKSVAAAKRTVDYYSLNFPFVRGARYVPEQRMKDLTERLRAHKEIFDEAVGIFVDEYDTNKANMMPVIEKALQDAARTSVAAVFAYDRVRSEYPDAQEVKAKFGMRWNIYAIRAPKNAATAQAAMDETESVKGIIRSMVGQLREEFIEKVGSIMNAVAKAGKIPAPTIEAAREVIGRVESMNVLGDQELSDQCARFKIVIDKAESNGAYTVRGASADLTEIKKAIDKSMEDAVADAEKSLTGVGRRKITAKGGK
jgi:hypothetical protein